MYLYKTNGEELQEIKENPFSKEIELHKLCESNLEKIFGVKLVKREFSIQGFRFDSLAFDESTNSFVIVEYKNTTNFSVVDQGYAYLSTMLNNKAEFIVEYNENLDRALRRDEVDWSQSRVIFVSPNFTNYQKQSVNFKDLPFELWEVKRYSDDIVYFNPIKVNKNSESIKTIASSNEQINTVNREIKVHTEESHIERGSEEITDIYENIKEYILSLDSNIEMKCRSSFIGFDLNNKNLIGILLNKKFLKIWLNAKWGTLKDYKNIFRDVSDIGHWGNGDYELMVSDEEDIDYINSMIKEVYNKSK